MLTTKFLKICSEGNTAGRISIHISRELLLEVEKNYNPKLYRASINIGHDRDNSGLGTVEELETREDEEGKLGLYARIAPTSRFIEVIDSKYKQFFSVEIFPNFLNKGESYLTGLALTDFPGSNSIPKIELEAKNNSFLCGDMERIELETKSEEEPQQSLLHKLFHARNFMKSNDNAAFIALEERISSLEKSREAGEQRKELSAKGKLELSTETFEETKNLEKRILDLEKMVLENQRTIEERKKQEEEKGKIELSAADFEEIVNKAQKKANKELILKLEASMVKQRNWQEDYFSGLGEKEEPFSLINDEDFC